LVKSSLPLGKVPWGLFLKVGWRFLQTGFQIKALIPYSGFQNLFPKIRKGRFGVPYFWRLLNWQKDYSLILA